MSHFWCSGPTPALLEGPLLHFPLTSQALVMISPGVEVACIVTVFSLCIAELRTVQTLGTTGEMVPDTQHGLGQLLDLIMWECLETPPRCTCLPLLAWNLIYLWVLIWSFF